MNCTLSAIRAASKQITGAFLPNDWSGNINGRAHPAKIEAILARCDLAVPGPWRSFVEGGDHSSGSILIRTAAGDIELAGASAQDQDFIAGARQDIARLVEEVMRLGG